MNIRLFARSSYVLCAWGAVLLSAAAGCSMIHGSDPSPHEVTGLRQDVELAELRAAAQEYLVNFTARVSSDADTIAAQTGDPEIRRNALRWKLNAIPEMREACFRARPAAALFDAWIMAAQMDAFFRDGGGSALFGDQQPVVVAASESLLEEIRSIWNDASPSEAERDGWESRYVTPWVEQHPLTSLDFARASVLAQFAPLAEDRGGVISRVRSLDEQVAILSAQTRIYLANIQDQVRGEAALLVDEIAGTQEVGDLLEEVERAVSVAEAVPQLVRDERAVILEDIDRQRGIVLAEIQAEREIVLDAVRSERDAILTAVTQERSLILAAVESERVAVLGDVDRQRAETIEELGLLVAAERARAIDDAERIVSASILEVDRQAGGIVDVVTIRLGALIIGLIVAAPLVAHVYVRVWPRSKHAPVRER